jgi:Protein-L-isoaspartate(D-aspartate) O-methyltransferase (PCMT)
LLAQLVGDQGTVTSIDVDAAIAGQARRTLKKAGYRASVVTGDGRRGWPDSAPYDRIIATACADRIPRAWLEQLGDRGLLELPLRLDHDPAAIQLIPVLQRRGEHLASIDLTWGGFMPLHGGDGGWASPPPTLVASRSSEQNETTLVSISGAAVAALPNPAAKKLLSAVLSRSRPIATGSLSMSSAKPPLLLIYLLLAIPAGRRLWLQTSESIGVGLIHRRAASAAFVSVPTPWRDEPHRYRERVRWRLDGYGREAAADEMRALLAEWRALRRRRAQLYITASGSSDNLDVSFAWG